jgi:hypothetical protein
MMFALEMPQKTRHTTIQRPHCQMVLTVFLLLSAASSALKPLNFIVLVMNPIPFADGGEFTGLQVKAL